MQITPDDTIWISMAGYDAGYIYEYQMHQTSEIPFRFKMIDDADDLEISSYIYKYVTYLIDFNCVKITISVTITNI